MSKTTKLQITPPKLPAATTPLDQASLAANATLKNFELRDVVLSHLAARGMDLGEAILDHVGLDAAKLTKLLINDCVFKRCGLANADCSEGSFIRVEFTDGRMTGWDANMSSLEDVVFSGCKLDMANFRATKMTRVHFKDCILTEADFIGAQMEDVAFEDCLLGKANFSQCQMKNVDLRSSDLTEISGWQSLKGATIDTVQLTAAAPYLANELGITAKD